MPTVGQAPKVIPIPELTDEEKQGRIADLAKATKLHQGVRAKAAGILPALDEMLRDLQQLHKHCEMTPTLRTLRLNRRLASDPLIRFVLAARVQLMELGKVSERAERNSGDIENDLLDPKLLR